MAQQHEARCDFCNGLDVERIYPYKDFEVESIGWNDEKPSEAKSETLEFVGDWKACAECYALIEAGNDEGLTARAASSSLSVPQCTSLPWRTFTLRFVATD